MRHVPTLPRLLAATLVPALAPAAQSQPGDDVLLRAERALRALGSPRWVHIDWVAWVDAPEKYREEDLAAFAKGSALAKQKRILPDETLQFLGGPFLTATADGLRECTHDLIGAIDADRLRRLLSMSRFPAFPDARPPWHLAALSRRSDEVVRRSQTDAPDFARWNALPPDTWADHFWGGYRFDLPDTLALASAVSLASRARTAAAQRDWTLDEHHLHLMADSEQAALFDCPILRASAPRVHVHLREVEPLLRLALESELDGSCWTRFEVVISQDRVVRVRLTSYLPFTTVVRRTCSLAVLDPGPQRAFDLADVLATPTPLDTVRDARAGGQRVLAPDDQELVRSFAPATAGIAVSVPSRKSPTEAIGPFAAPRAVPRLLRISLGDGRLPDLRLVNEGGEALVLTRVQSSDKRFVARPLGERAAPFGAVAIRLELAASLEAGARAEITAEWRCGGHSGKVVYPIVIER